MAAEILNKLRELQERNAYPMHMPGHKRVVDLGTGQPSSSRRNYKNSTGANGTAYRC